MRHPSVHVVSYDKTIRQHPVLWYLSFARLHTYVVQNVCAEWTSEWLSNESDSQFKRDIGDFSKLKTWTHHLSKLRLDTVRTYKDARVPKWFRSLLAKEFAKRTRPSLWARFSCVHTPQNANQELVTGDSRHIEPYWPVWRRHRDAAIQKFLACAFANEQGKYCGVCARQALNGTMVGDGEGTCPYWLLSSYICLILEYRMPCGNG